MKELFNLTYDCLMGLANLTGFSYKEINIIIWFIIIPLSWTILIDKIKGKHYFKISFLTLSLLTLVLIADFSAFSNSLFDTSADFLRSFDSIGSNYITTSVIICLILPLIIYGLLIRRAYFKNK
ncbi:hypothetical protein [Psychroserpens sp. SPM9]|uniref:hypothetical protein n=1 Tax=Psychroserpens sp. SPM9 TaxID=2975598 RepID=UPI0021A6CDDA|nr:hypothetical protein [Psychroserpens sp. SPM9]MDG5491270.1 hypothetical protein [Psychroserpens sp. SPM9]